jgi:hypothetical protein
VSATAVEAATTAAVEATTTAAVEATADCITVEAASGKSTPNRARSSEAATITRPSISKARTSIPEARPPINGPSIEATTEPKAATEPWSRANEEAAVKPRRTIVAIGRTGVGIIAVITVGAIWRIITIAPIHRPADSNPYRNLGMGIGRRGDQQDTE